VLSWPTVRSAPRERCFGMEGWEPARRLAWVNANLRAISRVIVHPRFRGIGLASRLIQCMFNDCDTRYIEALAVMGRVHRLFDAAGMTRIAGRKNEPAYFVLDRGERLPPRRVGVLAHHPDTVGEYAHPTRLDRHAIGTSNQFKGGDHVGSGKTIGALHDGRCAARLGEGIHAPAPAAPGGVRGARCPV
ncbi:MAG TPA: hypothetical protein VIL86_14285, partial [Tepidisphaeraceae bacterium]